MPLSRFSNYIYAGVWLLFLGLLLNGSSCQSPAVKEASEGQNTEANATALDSLDMLVRKDSLNPENYYRRALYNIDRQDVNSALSDIGRAIELDDKKASYYVALADIYLMMGRMPNCLESLQLAYEIAPDDNDVLLKLAEAYLILQDYKKTFEYADMALDLDRINPVAHFIRGYAYLEMGDTSLAIKNFQAAADQDQQYYNAYVELGVLYTRLRSPLATGYLQTAINIEPGRPEAWYLLGMAYQEMENFSKALETYDQLLTIDPDYKEAYYNSAYIYLVFLGEYDTAIQLFTRAIQLDPAYTDAYFNRGYGYELKGDVENARKDYMKAMEITPNYERSIIGLNRLDNLR